MDTISIGSIKNGGVLEFPVVKATILLWVVEESNDMLFSIESGRECCKLVVLSVAGMRGEGWMYKVEFVNAEWG